MLLSALDEGRLDAATATADLLRASGDPLGALYAAVLAFERGDEARARALAGRGAAPLTARGPAEKLRRALAARDAGAVSLLFDRRGELAATAVAGGAPAAAPGVEPLLAGVLERLPGPPSPRARLAVDLELSRLALDALGERRGSIVLVEPRTGAVLAAVSDPRTAAAEGAAAFTQRREPASIAKVLTAAAALRAGVDADAEIGRMTCTGVERYGGKPLWCAWPAGPLEGLDRALAVSCNVAFASLGVRLGAERLLEEHRRWGFDAGEGRVLGAAGRVHTLPRGDRDVADLSVGLEKADVTPLHAALLAAVVASEGRLAEPRVLLGDGGILGSPGDRGSPADDAREVLSPAVARRLRRAMEAVALEGTGGGLAPEGLRVAMKTGTAAEPGRGYHVNYVGMAPLPDPAVAFCVRVTNERTSPAVTTAARDVTRRLLHSLAERPGALRPAVQPTSGTWTETARP